LLATVVPETVNALGVMVSTPLIDGAIVAKLRVALVTVGVPAKMLYVSTALTDDAAVEIVTLIVVVFPKPAEASLNDKRVEPAETVLPVWLRV
jgi:hypothetical protein